MNSKKTVKYDNTVAPNVQKLFIIAALAIFLLSTAIQIRSAYFMIQYSNTWPSLVWWTIFPIVWPLLFFASAYAMNPRKGFQLTPLFENTLLALIGLASYGVIDSVLQQFVGPFSSPHNSALGYFTVDLIVGAICLILFGLGVYFLLRHKPRVSQKA
jgi:hypothetical protein